MTRILFVDDEQQVLDGLAATLRRERRRWDLTFVNGGPAALEEIRREPFDVVVTDVRMPGITGDQLLEEVRRLNPSTARIVLSGQTDERTSWRLVRTAHQVLAKPCEREVIVAAIERSLAFRGRLNDAELLRLVGDVSDLPVLPQIYAQITATLEDQTAPLGRVAQIVERDPALSAKVLQVVNSAFFGLPRRVTDLERAVTFLGGSALQAVVLSVEVFSVLSHRYPLPGLNLAERYERALAGAGLAKEIALRIDRRAGEDAFLAGLLVDLGLALLVARAPEVIGPVAARAAAEGVPLHEVEREEMGVTHHEVGAYVLGLWGLPTTVALAVAHVADPAAAGGTGLDVATAVHVAAALSGGEIPLDEEHIERSGLMGALDDWRDAARRRADRDSQEVGAR